MKQRRTFRSRVQSPRHVVLRRAALVALSLLAALAGVLAATGGPGHTPSPTTRRATLPSIPAVVGTGRAPTPATTGLRSSVDARALTQARQVTARFLAAYLPYLYGRRPARTLHGLAPGLRAELARHPPRVTPAERSRRPRLLALVAIGRPNGAVLVSATVADGDPAAYPIRLLLTRLSHRWLVTSVVP